MTMSFLKTDFTRFFALGFVGGAALVMAAMGLDAAHNLVDGVVPPAQAAATH